MRKVRRSAFLCILLAFLQVALLSAVDHRKYSEAESDGLLGPVKTVATKSEVANRLPSLGVPMPGIIVVPITCWACAYDQQGNRLRSSKETGSEERTRLVLDGAGEVRERIVENEKRELVRHVWLGPFGMTEMKQYENGALRSRQTIDYSGQGTTKVIRYFDGNGVETGSSKQRLDENGNLVEVWNYGRKNVFLNHHTDLVDEAARTETFTELGEDGKVRLSWIAHNNEVVNFRQEGDKPQPGSRVCFATEAKKQVCQSRNADGSFTQVAMEFRDESRRFPVHAEFRDINHEVLETGDYEYEFDSRGNWIRRSLWVWTSESNERTLVQVQSRTLTYWTK